MKCPWLAFVILLVAGVGSMLSLDTGARSQPSVDEPGVTGYVLAADGTPVSGGTVTVRSGATSASAAIDLAGRFRLVPTAAGVHRFLVNVPGFAPFRFTAAIPSSRSLPLPVIRLTAAAYLRLRIVSPTGEPIVAPRLRWRHFDANGTEVGDALAMRQPNAGDEAVTIGPLSRGTLALAIDMPPFAQTRLPDVVVIDPDQDVDAGTVVLQQPGAVLDVDVLDAGGTPIPNHPVSLEDVRPASPLQFRLERTNPLGRATFDRLAAGQYRVTSTTPVPCAGAPLTVSRVVRVAANGSAEIPIVVGGRASFRITSPFGPVTGRIVSVSPSASMPQTPPFLLRAIPSACRGATDGDGRVTLTGFPPGPAQIEVRVGNSTYVRQIDVPRDGPELVIAIPDGFLPVRVVDDRDQPVSGAGIVWSGSGGRVRAATSATGEALLEAVGVEGGSLAVTAPGCGPFEESLAEPPGVLHTVALKRLPGSVPMRVRVATMAGEPIPDAIVELRPSDPGAASHVEVTDGRGIARFATLLPVDVSVSAERFVRSTMRIAPDTVGEVSFTLSPGYRAIVDVELPETTGPQRVRVLNENSRSMEDVLDGESDRRISPRGRLSLGPLPPGTYVIELSGADGRRQQRVRIVDADTYVTMR